MASIDVKHDLKQLQRSLRRYPDQVAFATSKAITATVFDAKRAVDSQIPRKLDRPVPFTKRGAIRVEKATKRKQVGVVLIPANRWDYLRWVVEGGVKRPAKKALPVPVHQKLNRYGNLPRRTIDRLRAKGQKTGHGSTFSGVPKGHPGAEPGIYMRIGRRQRAKNTRKGTRQKAMSSGQATLKLLVGYRKRAHYQPGQLPFFRIVRGVVSNRLPRRIEQSVEFALRTKR